MRLTPVSRNEGAIMLSGRGRNQMYRSHGALGSSASRRPPGPRAADAAASLMPRPTGYVRSEGGHPADQIIGVRVAQSAFALRRVRSGLESARISQNPVLYRHLPGVGDTGGQARIRGTPVGVIDDAGCGEIRALGVLRVVPAVVRAVQIDVVGVVGRQGGRRSPGELRHVGAVG